MLYIYLLVTLVSGGLDYSPQGPIGKGDILIAAGLVPGDVCARIAAESVKGRIRINDDLPPELRAVSVKPFCIYQP